MTTQSESRLCLSFSDTPCRQCAEGAIERLRPIKSVAFADFRELDASELVRVHDVVSAAPLSRTFRGIFGEILRSRNRIYHLGMFSKAIDPQVIIDILQMQYSELYPVRRWMTDRLHFATFHRWGDHADSDYTERLALFFELRQLILGLSQPCESEVPTAFQAGDALEIHCVICDRAHEMATGSCPGEDCGSDLTGAEKGI